MLKIAVLGASGRMGQAVIRCIDEAEDLLITGGVTEPGDVAIGRDIGQLCGIDTLDICLTDNAEKVLNEAQVAIDFTLPSATIENVNACVSSNTAFVIGTTGLKQKEMNALEYGATKIPVVHGRNMSVGMNVFIDLVSRATKALEADYDVEITEAHHRKKIDSPSGTALALGEEIAKIRGQKFDDIAVYERHGHVGARTPGTIGFSVVRAGNIVGDHTVLFAGPEEGVELTHRAIDRSAFARGAVRAAKWASKRKPGLYTMGDVLGL